MNKVRIKESLEEKGKCNLIEPKDSGKDKKLLESHTDLKGEYSRNSVVKEYPRIKRYRSKGKKLLAKEIAEELKDDHSLGAFLTVVHYKFKKISHIRLWYYKVIFLDKKTYDLLHATYKKSQELYKTLYDYYLSMGNFAELILYIYITDNIEKKILDVFKFDFGIKKIT